MELFYKKRIWSILALIVLLFHNTKKSFAIEDVAIWTKQDLELQLGPQWGEDKSSFGTINGKNGGITKVTLTAAPNGTYDLWLRVDHVNVSGKDPQPRFLLDNQNYDFVPNAGKNLGFQWKRIKKIQIKNNRYSFNLDDLPNGGVSVLRAKITDNGGNQSPPPAGDQVNGVTILAIPGEGKVPLNVKFRAVSDNPQANLKNYKWDFGDGTTSNLPTPKHTFRIPGVNEVRLTVTDGNKIEKATFPINVTTTKWTKKQLLLNLGNGWTQSKSTFGCTNGINGGVTTVTLHGAPNGLYDLWALAFHKFRHINDPHPRFKLDGKVYDFVPTGTKKGYEWVKIKSIPINHNSHTIKIDDVPDGGVLFQAFEVRETPNTVNPNISIIPSIDWGELPLTVDFDVQSKISISQYSWDFGDGSGGKSTLKKPRYTYKTMGLFKASLIYTDSQGKSGLAIAHITVKPSKTDLPGLKDLAHFGFWSPGLKMLSQTSFGQRRMDELEAFNMSGAFPAIYFQGWYSTPMGRQAYHQFLDDLGSHGIETGIQFAGKGHWFRNDENGQHKSKWIFDPKEVEAKFKVTDADGDGISDLDGRIGWVQLSHETGEYANHEVRKKMYETAAQYFPNTPLFHWYGSINLSFERSGLAHPAGGLHDAYQFGIGETDIVPMGVPGSFITNPNGQKQFDPVGTVEALKVNKRYASSVEPDLPIWVVLTLPGEKSKHKPADMWSGEQILDYARALLTVGGFDGLAIRAYDRWKFDLGYGVNTNNPSKPEFGFIEQREAVRTIGSWIKQTQAKQPILIIRSPDLGADTKGPSLNIRYAIIGTNTNQVKEAVFQLDKKSKLRDVDKDGLFSFNNVSKGDHVLKGHLVNKNGSVIDGTSVTVYFTRAQ